MALSNKERQRRFRAKRKAERERQSATLANPGNPLAPDVEGLIRWMEASLTVSQGREAGKPYTVLPWQQQALREALAPSTRDMAITMGRGGGKSTFAGALLAAALAGPIRQSRGECLLVASSFQQARVVYEHILAFMQPWLASNPGDWKVEDSSQRAAITHKPSGARARCIGSDPKRAHGLAPYLAILDEPSQWLPNTREKMLAAIETASGKVPGSRRIIIGTRPDDESHFFEKMLTGGADKAMVYACSPDVKNPHDPATWHQANPSLRFMPDLLDAIEGESRKAQSDPSRLASFKTYRLNTGTSDVVHRQLLDAALFAMHESSDAERIGKFVLGVDLAGGAAMSAFAGYWIETGRLECFAAFPSQPGLKDRGIADGVGELYVKMAQRGELLQSGEHAVDMVELLTIVLERWGRPSAIACDRWKERDLKEALHRCRFPVVPFLPRGQGFKEGSEDVGGFRRAFAEGRVKPVPSLLLRSALRESRTIADPSRNEKLAKQSEAGRRANARDDAAAASIVAVAAGYREIMRRLGKAA